MVYFAPMSEPLRAIYASDDGYVGLAAISAVSLLKHNPGAQINLLGYKLKSDSIELVRSRIEQHGGSFCHFDVTPLISKLELLKVSHYTSYAIFARMFIPELIHTDDRVLYLDCDTLITDRLDDLMGIDLHGHAFALALDAVHPAYKKVISLPPDKPYYNSGVMLMDLAAWRKHDCSRRFMEELAHPHGHVILPEQDVIARMMGDEVEPLPSKWNFLSQFILQNRKDSPAIYHFSGNTLGRPWFTSSKHPLREAYRQAAAEANLPEVAEQIRPLPFEYKVQYWLYRLLPQSLFTPICNLMYRTHIRLAYGV